MTDPVIFTVILNWNQVQLTLACLASLLRSDYQNQKVILVDNGSSDGSPVMIRQRFPEVVVLENRENLGYSAGNNVGIRYALQQGADLIFLLNNDTEVHPAMLSRLVETANEFPQAGIVGPSMYYFEPQDMLWGGENCIDWRRALAHRKGLGERIDPAAFENQPALPVDYIDSCAVLIRRQALEKAGCLDERYFINFDDLDLNFRIHQAGFDVLYVPPALMWHKVSAAMGLASPATTYYMARNALLFFSTHAPGFWKIWDVIIIFGGHLRTLAAWSLQSRYRNELYQRKRRALWLGLRDFLLGRYGKMGADVAGVCFATLRAS